MSKLIVDMPMPKRCYDCPIHDYASDRRSSLPSEVRPVCNAHHELKPIPNGNERPDWCPIKGVLPEQHGDLIDRDALLKECYPDDEFDAHVIYADDIHKAKAVIAAERKDDDKTGSNTPS